MPRMRTIDGVYLEIHKLDPDSQVKKNFVRQLVINGIVKSVKAGNKYLVNLDEVLEYLSNPCIESKVNEDVARYGTLRKVQA